MARRAQRSARDARSRYTSLPSARSPSRIITYDALATMANPTTVGVVTVHDIAIDTTTHALTPHNNALPISTSGRLPSESRTRHGDTPRASSSGRNAPCPTMPATNAPSSAMSAAAINSVLDVGQLSLIM